MNKKEHTTKKGRPESRILQINARPEYVAKAMFAAGKNGSKKKNINTMKSKD